MCASIYGNPEEIIITFAATPISITILAEKLSGIGMIIDEKQSSFNEKEIQRVIYTLAEGRTRLKAKKDGDLVPNKKYDINVITSGEEPIKNENSNTGSSKRTIEVYAKGLFEDEKMSRDMHRICKKYYGTAGRKFIENIINDYAESEYEEIKNKYKEIEELLEQKADNDISSYISGIAIVVLADFLVGKYFFETNFESSIEMGLKILNSLETSNEVDVIEKAKEFIESWIIANDGSFDRHTIIKDNYSLEDDKGILTESIQKGNNRLERYGLYENNTYYILPHIFNGILLKNGYSPNKIRKGFAERRLYKNYSR